DYFEAVAKGSGEPKLAANWVMVDLAAFLNKAEMSLAECPVQPEQLAGLIVRIKDGTISGKIAKQVFEGMCAGEGDADSIIASRGLKQVSDTGELEKLVDDVLANNQAQVENYKNADDSKRPKMLGFFVGQI